jgi:AbrB family looped-hinge helix DNA binding protein
MTTTLTGKNQITVPAEIARKLGLAPGARFDWAVTPEKIQKAVQRIVEAARPVRIIMFGSQARGEANQDSDVDLMVVTAELSDEERLKEMVRLRELLRPLRLPVEVLVVPAAKLEYWRETPGNVYYEASVDGVVLYEQGN